MSNYKNTDLKLSNVGGKTSYTNEFFISVARVAMQGIEGIAETNKNVINNITNFFSKNSSGIKVRFGSSEIAYDINIEVYFDTNVPQLCETIHQNIKKTVESMTEFNVIEININVVNVIVPE